MNFRIRAPYYSLFFVAIGFLFCLTFQNAFAQSGCLLYPSGGIVPSGYGASWDVLSSGKELLVKSNCPTSGTLLTITVGKGDTTQYIWKTSYMYNSAATPKAWVSFTLDTPLPSAVDSGNWITAGSAKNVTMPFIPTTANPLYIVGYVCTPVGSIWKCGCANASCVSKLWQLQGYTGAGLGGEPGTVATPTISPSGGTFTTSQVVTLADATSGAVIHYTLDGSVPLESSNTYSVPFTITETKTVKAKAWKTGLDASAVASATFTKGGSASKPNIVVIMTDDQDYKSLNKMPKVKTLLTDKGMTFTNLYENYALCCPARATFLTGQFSINSSVEGNNPPEGGVGNLRDGKTLPVWLKAAGYTTFTTGKYLNGYGQETSRTYIPPGWDQWFVHPDPDAYRYFDYDVNENGVIRHYGSTASDYHGDVITRTSVNFINSRAESTTPFFMWINYLTPHVDNSISPRHPVPAPRHAGMFASEPLPKGPNFNEADMSDKPAFIVNSLMSASTITEITQLYRYRIEALQSVDEGVQDIINALQSTGKLANTYVIFTTDNGYYLGEHRLPREKNGYYTAAIHLPLIIRGPGIANGTTNASLVTNADFAPTFVDIADATSTITVDGKSLVPLFSGTPTWRTATFIDGTARIPSAPKFDGVRTARYLYVVHANGEKELYDYQLDPNELDNKAGRAGYSAVQADLASKLTTLKNCSGATCWVTSAVPVP